MAKYCLRRLASISKKGPRGKSPSVAEIETASVSNQKIRELDLKYIIPFIGRRLQPINFWGIT